MTRDELIKKFPKASESFIKANLYAQCAGEVAKPQPAVGTQQVHPCEDEKKDTGRFLVSVTSVRKRLIDADNLTPKWHIDCLRYSGILPDDSPDKCEIKISQRKCKKGEDETIEITVDRID